MIVSVAEMKSAEHAAFADGVSAESLMDEAGELMARAIRQFFPNPGVCAAVFGKGNNGGDALAASRHLAAWGWDVRLVPAFPEIDWGPLVRRKHCEADGCRTVTPDSLRDLAGHPLIVLDGLLGIGAEGPLRDPIASLTRQINALRQTAGAWVFALDLPTGLHGDTGITDQACIVADTTLTVGFPKRGLVADCATNHTGRIAVLPLAELTRRAPTNDAEAVTTPRDLAAVMPRRRFDTHKGDFGRVAIVAGSAPFMGAAVLCSAGALRAGAGLLTLHVPSGVSAAIAAKLPPEIMLREFRSADDVLSTHADVIAVGPGIGRDHDAEIIRLIKAATVTAVIDADAINALAANPDVLAHSNAPRLLTPHPGEMARLDPGSTSRCRRDTAGAFTRRFACTLLLKGARTIVAENGRPLSYNTTGTPGMAKGGNGDVLTGVIAALLAQNLSSYDAARLGAWLCGRASEIAISHGGETEETLTPSRALDFLGAALRDLRGGCF